MKFGKIHNLEIEHKTRTHFTERNKVESEIIKEAIDRGKTRDPLTHNIVMWPEQSFHNYELAKVLGKEMGREFVKNFESYRRRILEILDGRNTIVGLNGNEGNFGSLSEGFNYEEKNSVDFSDSDEYMITRHKLSEFLDKMDGFHPEDRFRLHGSDWQGNLSKLALQLYSMKNYQMFIDWNYTPLPKTENIINDFQKTVEAWGGLGPNFSCGVCFNEDLNPRRLVNKRSIPFQLMKEGSEIYSQDFSLSLELEIDDINSRRN